MAPAPSDSAIFGLPAFAPDQWQMTTGERLALEGLLSQLQPRLAVEIGTASGGSLRRILHHSEEVHSFDLVPHDLRPDVPLDNLTHHVGDSHVELPRLLAEFAAAGRNVDFVLVDGDHSSSGVQRDVEDLLASPAVGRTVMAIHDVNNPEVRSGLCNVAWDTYPKVCQVELDCVPGFIFAEEGLRNELWGGLGVVLIDGAAPQYGRERVHVDRYVPAQPMMQEAARRLAGGAPTGGPPAPAPETDPGGDEPLVRALNDALAACAYQERTIEVMAASLSWRVTRPLRQAASALRRLW